MKKAIFILSVALLWQASASCAPAPTRIPAPTERALLTTPTTPPASPAPAGTGTPAPTPGATLTLSSKAEEDLAIMRAAIGDAPGGFLFYLDAPGRTSNPQVLTLAADPRGARFNAVALAGNYGVKDHDFTLVCIVDYQQAPCRRDADEKALSFHLASRAETRLGLDMMLQVGTHDVVFLTFYDRGNHSADQAFRQNSRFLFSFQRVQIIVGNAPAKPAPTAPIAQQFSTKGSLQPGAAVFTLSRDPFVDPSQIPWHRQEISASAPLNFYATYSNPEQVTRTVALMAFLDFAQVPWDASHSTVFAELTAGARADVPALLAAPPAPGNHELVVVAVDNPFLDLAAEVTVAQPRSFFANSTDRVLIIVH